MHVFVEEKATGKLLADSMEWTMELPLAKNFGRISSAIRYCRAKNLNAVRLLLILRADGAKVRLEAFPVRLQSKSLRA